jgi:hypothetical protein
LELVADRMEKVGMKERFRKQQVTHYKGYKRENLKECGKAVERLESTLYITATFKHLNR